MRNALTSLTGVEADARRRNNSNYPTKIVDLGLTWMPASGWHAKSDRHATFVKEADRRKAIYSCTGHQFMHSFHPHQQIRSIR